MCGFSHRTFVTAPVTLKDFVSSNSAAAEWWATSGAMPTISQAIDRRTLVTLVIIGSSSKTSTACSSRLIIVDSAARLWDRHVDAQLYPHGFRRISPEATCPEAA